LRAGAAYCREKLKAIGEVREIVLSQLATLGSRCEVPTARGAFYFLLRVRPELNPMQLTDRLIREHRVAVIPGTAFGLTQGCYLRVAYAALHKESAAEGIGRLVRGLKKILGDTDL